MDTSHINLLSLIEHDVPLKRVASTDGGEYIGPCPWCGGTDRFHVWPQAKPPHYWCRGCKRRGDAIRYMTDYNNLSFRQTCELLGLSGFLPIRSTTLSSRSTPQHPSLIGRDWPAFSDPGWQPEAQRFIAWAQNNLHSPKGRRGLDYCHQRGLTNDVIEAAQLGYNPSERYEWWGGSRVHLLQGIVIPWIELDERGNGSGRSNETVWKVNVRRFGDELPKYKGDTGSANGLYGVSRLASGDVIVLVEGEFCALSLYIAAPDLVTPLATGSITASRLHRWLARLSLASKILVAFDADDAGDDAAKWWLTAFPDTAVRLRPWRHDVNDMLKARDDFEGWIKSAI